MILKRRVRILLDAEPLVRTERKDGSVYQRIYAWVRRIPSGRVATYGQIAAKIDGCSARMVGYAMAALPRGTNVPWHRVINSQGAISPRHRGEGAQRQRFLLEKEGVAFNAGGRVDLKAVRWNDAASKRRRGAGTAHPRDD